MSYGEVGKKIPQMLDSYRDMERKIVNDLVRQKVIDERVPPNTEPPVAA
jgi:hypothetical protein